MRDPVAGVLGLVEGRHRRARDAVHDAVGHLEHGHLQPQLARGGGDLQADVAAADDEHARARGAGGADAVGVGDGAQVVHALELAARHLQAPRAAAGGEQQRVVGQHQLVVEAHVALARGDVGDAPAPVGLHAVVGEELRRADREPLALERAGQVLLRQRRALVGHPRLIADQGQLPRVAASPQGVGGLHRRLAAPDDHDLLIH